MCNAVAHQVVAPTVPHRLRRVRFHFHWPTVPQVLEASGHNSGTSPDAGGYTATVGTANMCPCLYVLMYMMDPCR